LETNILPSDEPVPFRELDVDAMHAAAKAEAWGRKLGCAWLHITGMVPQGMENPVVLLRMGGEGLVYTPDGVPVAATTEVYMPENLPQSGGKYRAFSAFADEKGNIDLFVDCGYNGFMMVDVGKGRFGGAFVAQKNEETFAYYYDYLALFLLVSETQAKKRKKAIVKMLRKSYRQFVEGDIAGARVKLATRLQQPTPGPLELVAVGHGHLDLAWLWPVRETVRKAARTYTNAVNNLEKYPNYIYGTSQPQQLVWMRDQYPTVYERVKKAILDGRMEMQGGFWVESDTNIPSGESLIRQALYGRRFIKDEFGQDMKICWLPDAFGFSGNLPQILRGCGMEYFSTIKLAWNKVNQFPHHSFYWQGIDGSRVLVHMPPEGDYNSAAGPKNVLKASHNYKEKELGIALLVFGGGDGGGGPQENHIELLQRQQNLAGLPWVRFGSALEFFRRLAVSNVQNVYTGELYLETHQGTYTTQAKNKYYNRLSERMLHNAEVLATLHRMHGKAYPHEMLADMWKEVLLNQFHDIIPGSSIGRVYKESLEAYRELEQMLNEYIQASLVVRGQTSRRTALNLTSFPRDEFVKHDGRWYFASLPPYAAGTTMEVEEGEEELKHDAKTLKNDCIKLVFNSYGEIESYIDAEGNEVAGEYLNRLVLYKDKFTIPFNAWDIDPGYYKKSHKRLKPTSVRTYQDCVQVVRENTYKYSKFTIVQKIILTQYSDIVRFETEVDWREKHHMLRAEFAPAAYDEQVKCDIQFGYIERATTENDLVEKAQFEVCAHKWVATKKGLQGFALLNDCKYGHRVKNGVISLNLLRAPTFPDKTADRGHHRFTYAIAPFNSVKLEYVVQEAYKLNNPLLIGEGVVFESLAQTSDPAVVIETIKAAEDDSAVIIRLYESCGRPVDVELQTRIPQKWARAADMLENPLEDDLLDLKRLHFGPFEVKTIRLEEKVK
jgi:alpha-mannosidase